MCLLFSPEAVALGEKNQLSRLQDEPLGLGVVCPAFWAGSSHTSHHWLSSLESPFLREGLKGSLLAFVPNLWLLLCAMNFSESGSRFSMAGRFVFRGGV